MGNGSRDVRRMELPSCVESLHEVVDAAAQVTADLEMSEDACDEVAIALTEAVNNAIFHGNEGVREKPFTVEFTVVDGMLHIAVLDQGPGFDPAEVPDPLAEENLLNPSGRGLLMMRAMVDEVQHQFCAAGTRVVLRKRIAS